MTDAMPGDRSANLVPAHPQNVNAVRSGIYSRTGRVLAPRAEEIAERLMELPHASSIDSVAAEEIGTIVATLEAIDKDLRERPARGLGRKTLLENKARLGRELRTWLAAFGALPSARADWAAKLSRPSLADVLADLNARNGSDGDD
jgi:hypothetical protein